MTSCPRASSTTSRCDVPVTTLDLRFFWQLLEVLPAAQAAAGDLREAEADVAQMRAHLNDITDAGRGEVAEMLRPFYIEYLTRKA